MNDQLVLFVLFLLALAFAALVAKWLDLNLRVALLIDRQDAMHAVLVNIHERLELVSAQSIDTAKHVGGQDQVISTLADQVLRFIQRGK